MTSKIKSAHRDLKGANRSAEKEDLEATKSLKTSSAAMREPFEDGFDGN